MTVTVAVAVPVTVKASLTVAVPVTTAVTGTLTGVVTVTIAVAMAVTVTIAVAMAVTVTFAATTAVAGEGAGVWRGRLQGELETAGKREPGGPFTQAQPTEGSQAAITTTPVNNTSVISTVETTVTVWEANRGVQRGPYCGWTDGRAG